jgi:hypothetical protein
MKKEECFQKGDIEGVIPWCYNLSCVWNRLQNRHFRFLWEFVFCYFGYTGVMYCYREYMAGIMHEAYFPLSLFVLISSLYGMFKVLFDKREVVVVEEKK